MKVALFSKGNLNDHIQIYSTVINKLIENKIEIMFHTNFEKPLEHLVAYDIKNNILENHSDLIENRVDFIISIGGDGTFLNTLIFVKNSNIPVIGINTGRLGFLANNLVEDLDQIIFCLINKQYSLESRSVIELKSKTSLFKEDNFALNDFTIHKRDNSSLTAITTFLNGDFFNKYWGDGLIVSTPTGSTAYSMSCGGPIVYPESKNFVITPVAPHNLNVRPVIVPDHVELSFEIMSRDKEFIVALDSRYKIVDQTYKLKLRKADFNLQTVRLNEQKFSEIIREKLSWGIDYRNV
ncbi:MAG: NAD kinase [Bacteroidetes bacterium]|nr:NAD kinase [Bacteroidota bacterium]